MLQSTGQEPNKNASAMESHIFKKAKSKDEYLGLLAKLYLHLKEMSKSKYLPKSLLALTHIYCDAVA